MLKIDQLSKLYTSSFLKKPTHALRGVSLTVQNAEIFGIVGPNGAGKSTLLKILLGLVKPSSGSVYLNGIPPSDCLCRNNLGFLAENPCLYESLCLVDHLVFIARVTNIPRGQWQSMMTDVLEKVGLGHVATRPIRTFSKGMVQRAALACALFTCPQILILDEPMSGLDPLGRKMVVDIIRDYNAQGNTVLFCSHILTDVERMCDRIAIMDKGQLKVTVTPRQLQTEVTCNEGESPLETLFIQVVEGGC
ncbi:MAG: ABC transporter ATP-binding protein [Desulfuromonadaceae bacterium]|nr:ABC transporter ATP-binding protein [Desulfuromonadaceae bacterium]